MHKILLGFLGLFLLFPGQYAWACSVCGHASDHVDLEFDPVFYHTHFGDTMVFSPPSHFQFKRKTEYFIPRRYRTADFENRRINIYSYDVTRIPDSLPLVMEDLIHGKRFYTPIKGRITSGFGPRSLFGSKFHYGIDIKLEVGDTLVAALDGVVRIVRNDPNGYGNFIVIMHKEGLETLYGHLEEPLVEVGQPVKAGEIIGLGGNTGRSTGSHLHFEFRFMGRQFDPAHVLTMDELKLKASVIYLSPDWFMHLRSPFNREYHIVRSGDSLAEIASENRTSVKKICRLNDIKPGDALVPGRKLFLQEDED